MSKQAFYDHVQRGHIHWLLLAFAGGTALGGVLALADPWLAGVLLLMAGVFVLLGMSVRELRVRGDGDVLEIGFGPLRWLRKRVPFATMRSLRRDRTTLIDGIGVHWIPGRGWTWTVANGPTVVVETEGQTLRIGTDDPDGLLAFLCARTGLSDFGEPSRD